MMIWNGCWAKFHNNSHKIIEELEFQFETIYQENYQKVIRLCLGYVNGHQALAEDLAQEVFLKVWQHLPNFRKEAHISTWIYRITVNTCLLELRKKKFNKGQEVLDNVTSDTDGEPLDHEERMRKMYNCINKLSKENRSIILLELEGIPQKEIAAITGVSHEAIRVRVHRIKNNLTKCVQHEVI
ncbi:MAG: sigma-70 family RNA polymerase sigma factor [Bacteroidota bacterium]